MLTQAVTKPPIQRRGRANKQAHLNSVQRVCISKDPHDCIKSLKLGDPCMGSGHILCYFFDVLMRIYESQGWSKRDAAQSILKNNLYGLDIDDRAYQLAYFAVMMKARQYDRRILTRGIEPHVYAIRESNGIDRSMVEYFVNGDSVLKEAMDSILTEMRDAREYGSLIQVTPVDFAALYRRFNETKDDISFYRERILNELLPLVHVAEMLSQKYLTIVTNPPYMGASNMNSALSDFVKKNYSNSKSDLSTAFMEKALSMCESTGMIAMINIPVWMFLSSYEKLREKIIYGNTLISMVHPGRGIFGSDFGTTTFVIAKSYIAEYKGHYRRLFDKQGEVESIETREQRFFEGRGTFYAKQSNFSKIPGSPVAYWVGEKIIDIFGKGVKIDQVSDYTASQNKTANNEKYLRYFWEVPNEKIGIDRRWVFYMKGGDFRKHYGNIELIIDWSEAARDFYKNNTTSNLLSKDYWYIEGITYTMLTSKGPNFRYMPPYCVFDMGGPAIGSFYDNKNLYYVLAFLNTTITTLFLHLLNPTINLQAKDIKSIPLIVDENRKDIVVGIEKTCVNLSRADWDAFETSWDFARHPLVRGLPTVAESHSAWQQECETRSQTLKSNEEELNRIFIDIYGLQDELAPEEEDRDVTVRRIFDTKEDIPESMRGSNYALTKRDVIVSLISYAVGCMFGRYSLDVDGLAYAGGEWDADKYSTFLPDADNILPITDEEYFDDDVVGLFCAWLKKAYGADTLEQNLDFIAKGLGNKGNTSREVIRNYFLNGFFSDHCKTYQKRPIYWLFDSGKQNGFKALVYLHRYTQDTIGNLRIDYLHRMQRIYDSEMNRMQDTIDNSKAPREIAVATKRKEKLRRQLKECREYDEKISHLALSRIALDLDNGVKVNYRKAQTATDGKFYEVLSGSKNIIGKM